jgi:glutamyl-tRNA synthetase
MGWDVPSFSHIPLIHGADGAKLSKRHGALGVDAYRDEMGLLPEAVNNYLLRLGWGHGDDEIISRDQAIEWFDIEAVGRSPARFDFKKLENLNGHYMREADDSRLAALSAPHVEQRLNRSMTEAESGRLLAAIPALKARAKTLLELADGALFLFETAPLTFEEKAQSLIDGAPEGLLEQLDAVLQGVDDWSMDSLDVAVRTVAEQRELGLGKVAQPLRAALTGRAVSPGIFDVLFLLGKTESLQRLRAALTA